MNTNTIYWPSLLFTQLTNPFCSKLDISFVLILSLNVIAHVDIFKFVLFTISCKDGMLCVYKGNGKKFTDLNLKEIRDEAEKKWNWSFSSPSDTQWWLFFVFWNWNLKTHVNLMLKCNVCIAQCLLVGYYKSSDQSNKSGSVQRWVVCRSLKKKIVGLYKKQTSPGYN